jgi:CII-binding regulator of phage lambda lysogenization HflD
MQPLAILDGLEIKLRQLSAAADRQRADYERVVTENQQLKQALDRQTGIVHSLKDKLQRNQPDEEAIDETVPTVSGKMDISQQQRETIEFCLKEVDRCLDWLQRN